MGSETRERGYTTPLTTRTRCGRPSKPRVPTSPTSTPRRFPTQKFRTRDPNLAPTAISLPDAASAAKERQGHDRAAGAESGGRDGVAGGCSNAEDVTSSTVALDGDGLEIVCSANCCVFASGRMATSGAWRERRRSTCYEGRTVGRVLPTRVVEVATWRPEGEGEGLGMGIGSRRWW